MKVDIKGGIKRTTRPVGILWKKHMEGDPSVERGVVYTKMGFVSFCVLHKPEPDFPSGKTFLQFFYKGYLHTWGLGKAYTNDALVNKAKELTRRVYAKSKRSK